MKLRSCSCRDCPKKKKKKNTDWVLLNPHLVVYCDNLPTRSILTALLIKAARMILSKQSHSSDYNPTLALTLPRIKTLPPAISQEIQPVHSEGDQPSDFFGRTDAKAETPIFWPPHPKSWLIGKDSDAGRDWGQEEKGTTEDEMAGWHHRLNGHEFRWTLGVGDGQGGLACWDSWGRKELDMTERLKWIELN